VLKNDRLPAWLSESSHPAPQSVLVSFVVSGQILTHRPSATLMGITPSEQENLCRQPALSRPKFSVIYLPTSVPESAPANKNALVFD